MKIFNKFIWSKKEPSNKNDVWFDGSTWRMYTEEAWQSFTLPVDAADKVAKVIENASEVYQEKLNAGEGIIIENNVISAILPDLSEYAKINDIATINGQSLIKGGNIVIEENSKIILDFEKLGEPIEGDEESMEMRYSKEQFENAVGMSMLEFIEKIKTSELVLSNGVGGMNSYYVVADEYTWTGYYKIPGLFNYVLSVYATPSEEKFFVSIYDESVDLPFATTEYVDEKHAQTETKLTELSAENERLKERIEEQELFIEDLQNMKIDKENDDYYPKMTVGLADNLAGVDVVESEINFRRSGGGAITDGVARIESIKGNSVVWNQLAKKATKSTTMNGVTFTVNPDGSITANGTASATAYILINQKFYTDSSHKYAIFGTPNGGSNETYYFGDGNALNDRDGNGTIVNGMGGSSNFACRVQSGTTANNVVYRPRLIDLTKMFGAGNEPTTIEEFNTRKPLGIDEYAYNEGEVIHMDVQSIESQGVNAWDEEWELGTFNNNGEEITTELNDTIRCDNPIEILPNTEYRFTIPNVASVSYMGFAFFYDSEGEYIKKLPIAGSAYPTVKTPANAHTMRFDIRREYGTTYKGDICINLSDTSVNGKYFPYIKRVEDLSIIRKYFPQGMKSAGTAHDEIRYNKASGKWEKVVRIGSVDMGTLNWKNLDTSNGMFWLSRQEVIDLNMATHDNENIPTNLMSSLYASAPTYDIVNIDKVFRGPFTTKFSGYLTVKDEAYTDAASFKSAMAGVILYYELAEPIVTELDEADQFKDLDYQVWNAGTEKADAEGKSAPLAADITYGFNAIGKIKELESLVAALRAKVGI